MNQKNCPECGCDTFKCRDYDKSRKEFLELSRRFRRAAAEQAEARAGWTIKELELEEGMKWLQRKAKKQAEAIQRLENKLKKLGQQPYQETYTMRTASGEIITVPVKE